MLKFLFINISVFSLTVIAVINNDSKTSSIFNQRKGKLLVLPI